MAVLPSLADTYGYFAAEAAVHGVPVVHTNIQALPEIVGGHGWQLELPLDGNSEWAGIGQGPDHYEDAIVGLSVQLADAIRRYAADPDYWWERRTEVASIQAVRFGANRFQKLSEFYALASGK